MQSRASSVEQYLAELPPDRREAISAVRKVILANLDPDFEEGIQYGMIGYCVPHRVFPAGYHCDPKQPLSYAALASQKNYMSLYLMAVYGDPAQRAWLIREWTKAGKKLDMGKSCIRFKSLADLPLEVIGEAIRRVPVKGYVDRYVASLAARGKAVGGAKPAKKAAPSKASAKPATAKQAAPKKATVKKAASKKVAPKQAAPKKAAARKPATKK
jgi:hypothetical protein